jgi:hypothetical protein
VPAVVVARAGYCNPGCADIRRRDRQGAFGGYVLTRQTSPGKWSAATYKLIRTGEASDYDDAPSGYRAEASYSHATGRPRARAVIDGADDDGSNAFE